MSLRQLFEDQGTSELKKANQKSLRCREATDTLRVPNLVCHLDFDLPAMASPSYPGSHSAEAWRAGLGDAPGAPLGSTAPSAPVVGAPGMGGVLSKPPAGALSWWRRRRKDVVMPWPRAASRAPNAERRGTGSTWRAGVCGPYRRRRRMNQALEDEWDLAGGEAEGRLWVRRGRQIPKGWGGGRDGPSWEGPSPGHRPRPLPSIPSRRPCGEPRGQQAVEPCQGQRGCPVIVLALYLLPNGNERGLPLFSGERPRQMLTASRWARSEVICRGPVHVMRSNCTRRRRRCHSRAVLACRDEVKVSSKIWGGHRKWGPVPLSWGSWGGAADCGGGRGLRGPSGCSPPPDWGEGTHTGPPVPTVLGFWG